MEGTLWAFVPALVAIVLALVTKQVYVSLFLGIFTGSMLYVGGDILRALGTTYAVMSEKVGANVPIIVFLVVLGIFVVLIVFIVRKHFNLCGHENESRYELM